MKTTKKANHQANIVRVNDVFVHPNADTLELLNINGYQVVSKKGQFKVGDLAVYIQPDSIVPQTEPFKFIWQPYVDAVLATPCCSGNTNPTQVLPGEFLSECSDCHSIRPDEHTYIIVPEKKRRITVRKFRGEWSEGLLLPISDFPELNTWTHDSYGVAYTEGDDVSDLLGITHYDPDSGKEDGSETAAPKRKKSYPKSLRGWIGFLRNRIKKFLGFKDSLNDDSVDDSGLGIPVYDVDALKNYKDTFYEGEFVRVTEKIHGSNARYLFLEGKMYAGSRKLWKSENSTCGFRRILKEQPWIEEWCREHEGYVLWGELTPTQKGFDYGSKNLQFFVFDILGPDGKWLEDDHEFRVQLMHHSVPLLYKGNYYEHVVKELVDGQSKLGKHIREGVVVTSIPERHVRGLGRAQLKIVSNTFLEKDNK